MRLLFVSGVSVGGAYRSTIELADEMAHRGHRVAVLAGDRPGGGSAFDIHVRAVAKWGSRPGAALLRRTARRHGRAARLITAAHDGVAVLDSRVPENAYRDVASTFRPDVIVANSLPRMAFRWMSADRTATGIPLVLYAREAHAVTHITSSGLGPDLVIANSLHLAKQIRAAGRRCEVVPSAVDCSAATVASSRRTVLLVNPVPANRLDLVFALADRRPDVPFVLQESWPLTASERHEVEEQARARSNVELRSVAPSPATIYRDARVLLATYPAGRPRVVVEAQHNGIPVLGLDQPALAEAVGTGGFLVAPDAPLEDWCAALACIWDDPVKFEELRESCLRRAAVAETDPHEVADRFEAALRAIGAG